MRIRNGLTAVAGLAAASLVLAGCASGSTDGGDGGDALDGTGKTLNVMVAASGLYPEEQQQWFRDVSDRFEAETGAKVAFETFATANDELTKIQTSVVSGQGPDVYGLGTTFTPTASATGAFVTLGDAEWEQLGGRDRFLPSTLGISGPDPEHEVGIPFVSRPFVMAYNTRLLEEAGIDAPADDWDELAEQAKTLTGDGVHGLAVAYADNFDPWKFIWGMSVQAGNPILDLDAGEATIDDPAVRAAYETYFSWYADGLVDPEAIGWTNAQAVAAFAEGKSAYLLMTSANSRLTLDDSAVADEYAYSIMPTIPPGQSSNPAGGEPATSIISGDNLVVANYSKQQELAFAFVEMITRPDEQLGYFEIFGELPTNAEAAAGLESEYPELSAVVESASKSVGTPFTGAWGDTQLALTDVVVQSIPSLSSGGVGADELDERLAAAQKAAQSALDKAK